MRAVAWVIENRSTKWSKSILEVVMAPNQFTSMSEGRQAADGSWNFEFPPDADAQWQEAQKIVDEIVSGKDAADPTGGALYYANLKTATSGWFFEHISGNSADHPQMAAIGRHTFFA
jgi:spore germination cell wall hydrolase CwlJ-like protein